MELHLTPRLSAAVSLLGEHGGVADIGTDHGYLPAFLALRGREGRLVAADLREGPLSRARETAEKYGVQTRLEFCLSDGLQQVAPEGIDYAVMAGMGGETIRGILERAVQFDMTRLTLVLQPQSKLSELTEWMAQRGWQLLDAAMAKDAGRIYPMFSAIQTGAGDISEEGIYRCLIEKREPLLSEYLRGQIGVQKAALAGLKQGSSPTERIAAAEKKLAEFLRLEEAANSEIS